MLSAGEWSLGQQNLVTFVLLDSFGNEQTGLVDGVDYDAEISKVGGSLAPAAGTFGEIGRGIYSYLSTAAEADTRGPVSIAVFGAGITQQNLEYVVEGRNINAVEVDLPNIVSSVDSDPISGVVVTISTDVDENDILWVGFTDDFGEPLDPNGNQAWLDPGTYYVWARKSGFTADIYPYTLVIS